MAAVVAEERPRAELQMLVAPMPPVFVVPIDCPVAPEQSILN